MWSRMCDSDLRRCHANLGQIAIEHNLGVTNFGPLFGQIVGNAILYRFVSQVGFRAGLGHR